MYQEMSAQNRAVPIKNVQHTPACRKDGILLNFYIDTSKYMIQQLNRKIILKIIKTTSFLLQSGPASSLTDFLRKLSFHLYFMVSN